MRTKATFVATLLLAACSGGEQAGNEAGNAAGNQAAANAGDSAGGGDGGGGGGAVALQAGQWETTVQVTRMSMANMPGGVSPPTPPPTTVSYCLTPEQAARPSADFLTGSGESGGCTYQDFSMEGGRISGTVTCESAGTSMRSTMDGQFTPTGYEMNTQVQTTAQGMTMDMETRTTARRVGDCPAG